VSGLSAEVELLPISLILNAHVEGRKMWGRKMVKLASGSGMFLPSIFLPLLMRWP
jgi:hypothetical protein